jgi:hypothetical protein
LDAIQALSQLSYGPDARQCSSELVLLGPVNPFRLVVLGWAETQRDASALSEIIEQEEVTAVKLGGVPRERIDLVPRPRLSLLRRWSLSAKA